ncbi:MAG: type II toxin-antitoxin system HicA family toxin [Nitrosarchaeum sp.]
MKLGLVSGRDMCKILEKLGFVKVHQVGSHVRYVHPDGYKTVVPVHGNETLGRGLVNYQ